MHGHMNIKLKKKTLKTDLQPASKINQDHFNTSRNSSAVTNLK